MKPLHRNVLLGAMGIGLISMILTWFVDDTFHTRFWSNFTLNTMFFTMTAALALFFIAASMIAYAGWYITFKRIWEAFSMFLIIGLGLILFIGLGNYFGWHHIYHWADKAAVEADPILQGKSSFLNNNWYFFGTLLLLGGWTYMAYKIRQLSIDEDENGDASYSHHQKQKIYGAITLPLIGFTSVVLFWLWMMSIDAHWFSTMFAWYSTASAFVAMLSLTILLVIFLKKNGYLNLVNDNHLHDLGKYLFAFSIFWTYLWFSQFMLIWYANIGEETIYFKERYNNYSILFFANIAINFVVPFLILMRNDTKRKIGTMVFVSIVLLFGHWLDYFLMVKPGMLITAQHTAHGMEGANVPESVGFVSGFTIPGLLELGTFVGFLGLFLFVSLNVLSKSSLVPKNDPYFEESVHHVV